MTCTRQAHLLATFCMLSVGIWFGSNNTTILCLCRQDRFANSFGFSFFGYLVLKYVKLISHHVTGVQGEVLAQKLVQNLLRCRNEVLQIITLLISHLVGVGFAGTLQPNDNTHALFHSLVCKVSTAPDLPEVKRTCEHCCSVVVSDEVHFSQAQGAGLAGTLQVNDNTHAVLHSLVCKISAAPDLQGSNTHMSTVLL